jgi:hypothetical protein
MCSKVVSSHLVVVYSFAVRAPRKQTFFIDLLQVHGYRAAHNVMEKWNLVLPDDFMALPIDISHRLAGVSLHNANPTQDHTFHVAAVKDVAARTFIVSVTLARAPNEDLEARASFVLFLQHHGIVKCSRTVALMKHATLDEQYESYLFTERSGWLAQSGIARSELCRSANPNCSLALDTYSYLAVGEWECTSSTGQHLGSKCWEVCLPTDSFCAGIVGGLLFGGMKNCMGPPREDALFRQRS